MELNIFEIIIGGVVMGVVSVVILTILGRFNMHYCRPNCQMNCKYEQEDCPKCAEYKEKLKSIDVIVGEEG